MPPAYTSMDPYLCRTKTDSVLAYPGLTGIWRGGRLGKGWWRVRTKGGRQGSEPGVMPNLSLVSRAAWSSQTLLPSAQIWPPPIGKLPLPVVAQQHSQYLHRIQHKIGQPAFPGTSQVYAVHVLNHMFKVYFAPPHWVFEFQMLELSIRSSTLQQLLHLVPIGFNKISEHSSLCSERSKMLICLYHKNVFNLLDLKLN